MRTPLARRRRDAPPLAAHEVEAAERDRRRRSRRLRRTAHLAVARHRRLLVAGLVAGAVAAALRVVAPEPPASVEVTVAGADLAAGRTLAPGDLRRVRLSPAAVAHGVLDAPDLVGRRLAGSVRAGEPLTDVRLVGSSLLAGQPAGTRALTVPVVADALGLVSPGDRVDLLAGGGRVVDALGGAGPALPADVVARSVAVLAVLGTDTAGTGLLGGGPTVTDGSAGASIVVAADEPTARVLAGAAAVGSLTVALRPPGGSR